MTSSCFGITHIKWLSLYFLNTSCVGTRTPFKKWQSCYLQNVCVRKIKLRSHVVAVVSVHMCVVLPGCHWPLWRLASNNGKLLTQASLLNGASRLDHCDVIASLTPCAEQSWHSKPNVTYGRNLRKPNWTKNKPCVICHMVWKRGYQSLIPVYVPKLIPSVWLQLFKYGGGDNAQ